MPEAGGGRAGLCGGRKPAAVGARPGEVESIIGIVCTTRQPEVATVVIETEPQQGSVPMRAKAAVDAAAIMSTLGGGDMLAASDTSAGPAAEMVTALVTAVA